MTHYILLNFLIFLFVGIKESDTGLAPPALWDLAADKQTLQSEQPLQVARYVSALWFFIAKHILSLGLMQ